MSEFDHATTGSGPSRRSLLIGGAVVAAAAAGGVLSSASPAAADVLTSASSAKGLTAKPNILMILVDEMRFPKVFPAGVSNAGEFLAKFMPNTYALWQRGVKFSQHHSNANDCTPSRAVMFTGLYSQQTWLTTTIVGNPNSEHASSPVLNKAYPTYGKILRKLGYQTPYVGKWHLSQLQPDASNPGQGDLEAYGFDDLMYPDPTGGNLQGTYAQLPKFPSDADTASIAASWLQTKKSGDQPWCMTVGFINPHDKEFFPAGTEYQAFTAFFADPASNPTGLKQFKDYSTLPPSAAITYEQNALKSPKSYGYPELPPNWESYATLRANKPSYQSVVQKFQATIWGGVQEDRAAGWGMEQYPSVQGAAPSGYGIAKAPFSYWQRSLDSYTQIMEILDVQVGRVLAAMPKDVAANTIVMFSSDHGDYASAHGMVSGKSGTLYDECVRVPFIVFDPSGRFTNDEAKIRNGLTSHVDVLPMMVTIANGGSRNWIRGEYKELYGDRHDMNSMLRSANAPGRSHVLFANDEVITPALNFLSAPWHITGLITPRGKLGVYSNWRTPLMQIEREGQELEYYDYATAAGRLEVDNTYRSKTAQKANRLLQTKLIPGELRAPLPARLRPFALATRALNATFYTLAQNSAGLE